MITIRKITNIKDCSITELYQKAWVFIKKSKSLFYESKLLLGFIKGLAI